MKVGPRRDEAAPPSRARLRAARPVPGSSRCRPSRSRGCAHDRRGRQPAPLRSGRPAGRRCRARRDATADGSGIQRQSLLDLADRLFGVAATGQHETPRRPARQAGWGRASPPCAPPPPPPRSATSAAGFRPRRGGRRGVGVDRQRPLDIGLRLSQRGLAVFAGPAEARVGEMHVAEHGVEHRRAGIEGKRLLPAAAALQMELRGFRTRRS